MLVLRSECNAMLLPIACAAPDRVIYVEVLSVIGPSLDFAMLGVIASSNTEHRDAPVLQRIIRSESEHVSRRWQEVDVRRRGNGRKGSHGFECWHKNVVNQRVTLVLHAGVREFARPHLGNPDRDGGVPATKLSKSLQEWQVPQAVGHKEDVVRGDVDRDLGGGRQQRAGSNQLADATTDNPACPHGSGVGVAIQNDNLGAGRVGQDILSLIPCPIGQVHRMTAWSDTLRDQHGSVFSFVPLATAES